MDKIPFTIYDFFGYISTGIIWFITINYYFSLEYISTIPNELDKYILIVIAIYVLGHLSAQLSQWVLEDKILRVIGKPTEILFDTIKSKKKILKRYNESFKENLRNQIIEKYKNETKVPTIDSDMLKYCFHYVKEKSKNTNNRLLTFLSLYGFSRNMSFTLLLPIIAFTIKGIKSFEPMYFFYSFCMLILSYLLFLRFLKFYKLYAIEIFLTYLVIGKSDKLKSSNKYDPK